MSEDIYIWPSDMYDAIWKFIGDAEKLSDVRRKLSIHQIRMMIDAVLYASQPFISTAQVDDRLREVDPTKCPKCGGYTDNGFDRCLPPNAYYCSKCEHNSVNQIAGYGPPPTASDDVIVQHDKLAERVKVLEGAFEQLMDDLSGGTMQFPGHGVCEQAWNDARAALNDSGGGDK